MSETGTAPSAVAVLAAEPVIRRVIAARVGNAADVDDLVQDCLERLLGAAGRLAPETVLPFGIVTARNLAASHARTAARRASATPRLADMREPDRPEEVLLTAEAHRAMMLAMAKLSAQERADILAYYGESTRIPPTATGGSPGALRVRMSRTRAKLRLEYLLAFRRVTLPTERCHMVLTAISASDQRRQRDLNAGQHLLDCAVCAELCEPLERRSGALTAVTLPVGLVAWLLRGARAHPVQAAAVATGTAGVATAAVLVPHLLVAHPAPTPRPGTVAAPAVRLSPAPAIPGLRIGGREVNPRGPLTPLAGRTAIASRVAVLTTVTRNGFWIGTPQARLWVELTGPLRTLHIAAGDHVSFTGVVSRNGRAYPHRVGVTASGGAALLTHQGVHLSASTTSVRVFPPP